MNYTSDQANQVLEYLSNNYQSYSNYWVKTAPLLVRAGLVGELEHKDFRDMMMRLYNVGVVDKRGHGSFQWKMKVASWDKEYPFKKLATSPSPNTPEYKPIESKKQAFKEEADEPSKTDQVLKTLVEIMSSHSTALHEIKERLTVTEENSTRALALANEAKETAGSRVKTIEIKRYDGKTVKLKDKVLPKVFDRVLALAKCRRNVLLVGPAGCGKTYLGRLIADTLGLDFGSISCTSGMSESHLLGRSTPNLKTGENVYNGSAFIDCFESGGVYLLDELDAADPNLLLCINTALANGYVNVPNRRDQPRATRHHDFVCIATANTFGRGANRSYAGRNQLDEATLDRFRIGIVECDYDPAVESAVCPAIGGTGQNSWHWPAESVTSNGIDKLVNKGYNLRETCQYIRYQISRTGMRRIMSTRFIEDAYIMMKEGGWDLRTVLEAYLEGWTPEERAKITG